MADPKDKTVKKGSVRTHAEEHDKAKTPVNHNNQMGLYGVGGIGQFGPSGLGMFGPGGLDKFGPSGLYGLDLLPAKTRQTPAPAKQQAAPLYQGLGAINTDGSHLRVDGQIIRTLPFGTKVIVTGQAGRESWHVTSLDDGASGEMFYKLISTNPPDPAARLHKVEHGQGAEKIVDKYYGHYKWGEDRRFFENVLVYVNSASQGKKGGVYEDSDGNIQTVNDAAIWVPGEAYAQSLHGIVSSGSLTYELWGDVKLVAGFITGLLQGALESILDIFKGIGKLVKMAWDLVADIFNGTIISKAKDLYDKITAIDFHKLIDDQVANFEQKWNSPDPWDKGKFRGYVTGYAIMEVITLFFTAGLAEGIKYVGKFGKMAVEVVSNFSKELKLGEKVAAFQAKAGEKVSELTKFLKAGKKVAPRTENPEQFAEFTEYHPDGTKNMPGSKQEPLAMAGEGGFKAINDFEKQKAILGDKYIEGANFPNGENWEDAVIEMWKMDGWDVIEQFYFKDPVSGVKAKVDAIAIKGDKIVYIDAKFGKTGGLSWQQKIVYPKIANGEAVPTDKRASELFGAALHYMPQKVLINAVPK